MLKYLWCTLLIILLPFLIYAQTIVEPEWLTIKDGLSQGFVECIVQDQEGFLWMGSKNGLNRYDGEHFKVFTHDPADPYSISHDFILSLYDYGNFLLVGTEGGGLNLFHKQKERFYKIPLTNTGSENRELNDISTITKDSLGQLWVTITHSNLLFRLRFPDNFQTQFPQQEELVQSIEILEILKVRGIIIDHIVDLGDFILANDIDSHQILKIDIRTGESVLFEHQPPVNFSSGIQSFSTERLLMTSDKSIAVFKEGKWNIVNTDFNIVSLNYLDEDQQLLIEDEAGLLLFKQEVLDRSSFVRTDASFIIPILNKIGVSCFEKGKSGILWLGTGGYGVLKISPRLFKIKTYFDGSSIYAPPFATSDGEIYLWNPTTSETLYFPGDQPRLSHTCSIITDSLVGPLLEDESGALWFIHPGDDYETNIYKIQQDGTLKRMQTYTKPYTDPAIVVARDIDQGTILIAHIGMLISYQPAKEILQTYKFQGLNIRDYGIYSLAKTKNGHCWIGTNKGLIHAIPNGKGFEFELLKQKDGNQIGLLNNEIATLLRDPVDGNLLWVGTKGGGLHRLDTRDMSFSYLNSKNGLPNDVIYSVLNDDQDNLWMSSNKGIIRYNPSTGQIRNFTEADGLQSDEFNTYAYAKTSNGTMLFGGINGLNVFHPDDLKDNPVVPKVWITGLQINNENITVGDSTGLLTQAIEYTTELIFPFTQNNITLEFAGLEYSAPTKNRYRYYLEGAEEAWIHESSDNKASYLNLSPGDYTFKIKGSNGDGVWNEQVTSLKINILPPWYRSTFAYFVYAFLIAFVIWWVQKLRENRLRLKHEVEWEQKESERLKELDKMKSHFFTNISHELRTPLTIISGMTDRIGENPEKWLKKGRRMIKRNSDNLLNLVNQILDLRKLESGKLKLDLIQSDVIGYLKYIVESFHSLAENKDIQLHFQSVEPEVLMDYDSEKMLRIVSNLLSNAIKFTPEGGEIFVKSSIENLENHNKLISPHSKFIIEVKDTGIGIPADKLANIFDRFYQVDDSSTRKGEGTGIGLALTHELVKLMNGDIRVESMSNEGTVFTVKIPINKQAPLGHIKKEMTNQIGIDQTLILPNIHELEITVLSHQESLLPSLLIVEDNTDVLQYLVACLEEQFQLEVARDGQEGIEKAIEQVPDIILSDVMLPRKDGFELCQTLKTDERTSHIPIVLLTAKADQDSRISGLERGADAYLTKPFNKKELFVRLNNLLKIRKNLQERYGSLEGLPSKQEIAFQHEDEFIKKVRNAIEENLDDETFGIAELCKAVAMSRTQLHRKIKALTNRSTSLFVRSIRLQKAQNLLKTTNLNISQVAYEVGFSNPNYFSRIFAEEFGFPPTDLHK